MSSLFDFYIKRRCFIMEDKEKIVLTEEQEKEFSNNKGDDIDE